MDLPADLPLPLGSGAAWWYFLGGRPALDLVNTLRERWSRRVETLVTPDDLAEWLVRAEVVQSRPDVRPEVLAQARALREAIDALVSAAVEGRPAPDRAVLELDAWLPLAGTRPQLQLASDGALVLGERGPEDSARRALGLVALDAARMLTERPERIRICGATDCSARFYDRSPAGRRRWCSMERCGNVEKARRHRARQRGAV